MKTLILLLCLCGTAGAQVYAPPQTAIVYQPVAVQGYWQPVPRPLWIGNFLFGPVWTFTPVQQQPQVPPLQVQPQK